MRQSVTSKFKSAAGVSFAEMLACTVLFSLAFMVGVSGLLFAYHSTEQVMKEADAQTVSDAILNRIDGEIAGVVTQDSVMMDNNGVGASIVGFTGSSGIPVYICAKDVSGNLDVGDPTHDKELLIYYRSTTTNDADGNETKIPESCWTFDKTTYQGYKITNLNFTQGSHHGNLTVTTSLTLESPSGKSFTTTRTVCCYNRENTSVWHYSTGDVLNPPDDPTKQLEQASSFESALDVWLTAHGNVLPSSGEFSKGAFFEDYYETHSPVQVPDEYRDVLLQAGLFKGVSGWKKTMYWWSYPVTDSAGNYLYTVTFANEYSDASYWLNNDGNRTNIAKGYVVIVDGVTYLRTKPGTDNDASPGSIANTYQTKDSLIAKMLERGYITYN